MTLQRPAYLTTQSGSNLSDRAVSGMGSVLPPHISIRGNQFTLVDGAGNRRPHGAQLDFLIADLGDGKMYYANPQWTPDSDDPPDCWSTNGVGPSREAINPQARTCAECPQNVRGSRISNMGSSVKACRDEKILAVVLPQYPGMLFQMKVTPGSFKNWRKYVEECKNLGKQSGAEEDIGTVLTRAVFDAEAVGMLIFKAVSYPDEATWKARTAALASKATDVLVGRNDVPRALPAATPTTALAPPSNPNAPLSVGFNPQQGQPTATSQQPAGAPTPNVEPPQGTRRGRPRRHQAEQTTSQTAPQPASPAMAPFRPEAPAQPNGGAAFGVDPNPPGPSAEIEQALQSAFGQAPKSGGFGQ